MYYASYATNSPSKPLVEAGSTTSQPSSDLGTISYAIFNADIAVTTTIQLHPPAVANFLCSSAFLVAEARAPLLKKHGKLKTLESRGLPALLLLYIQLFKTEVR
jgi:hypothetical protein